MPHDKRPARILVVAGSDPVAGAGLQADLKTVTALGGYAMTAITAITVQDTGRVCRVEALPAELVGQQMRACLEDIGADGVKLGMLANRAIVEEVCRVLADWPGLPVVADPVLAGTAGGTLLEEAGLLLFRERLLPRVTLLTPNLREAALLSGRPVDTLDDMEQAARRLVTLGARAVLVTGGHLPGPTVTDLLWDGERVQRFATARLTASGGYHGTGCTLASGIATGMGQGLPLTEAILLAAEWVRRNLRGSLGWGKGQRLLWPG
ncbi:MAG: bifunctional hydroxymethylpyrimidine kinase/phosphomethylpyrimidine kinase [Magnetococcales bacterium]|nr:bifunctional hydroxymethylpyrimidine kinase/phosphomethylpyrimidine kinase [Magnetococcales bacterium]